jgi:hypothetical protein
MKSERPRLARKTTNLWDCDRRLLTRREALNVAIWSTAAGLVLPHSRWQSQPRKEGAAGYGYEYAYAYSFE